MSSQIEVNAADLDPNLIQLGVLVGLLLPNDDPATYLFNADWFSHPLENISDIPSLSGAQVIGLLETLLGGVAGNSIGTPANSISGSWYPISNPMADENGSNSPTGLYLVTTGADSGSPVAANQSQTIGIGILYPFTFEGLTFTLYAFLPIIEMPSVQGYFVLGKKPVELGLEITGASGAFGSGSVSFDGIKFAVKINFSGSSLAEDIKPEIVLLNLQLPGQQTPQNLSLLDLIAHGSIDGWISMGLSLLAVQLTQSISSVNEVDESNSSDNPLDEIGAMIEDVLALLGLAGDVPPFNWAGLLQQPSSIVKLLNDWFRAIAGSPASLKSWLNDWYCLRNGISASDGAAQNGFVTGTGTRAAPFAIELSEIAHQVSVSFTVATETDAAGTLRVYPGLLVATNIIHPIESSPIAEWAQSVGVQGRAAVEFIELVIPGANQTAPDIPLKQRLFPSFDVSVALLNGLDPTQPLIDIADPSSTDSPDDAQDPPVATSPTFSLGSVEIGLSYLEPSPSSPPGTLSSKPGARVFTPNFTLANVNTLYGSWNAIDLTNFNQDVQILKGVVTTIVQNALTEFLGTNDDNVAASTNAGSMAASIAVMLGIQAPPQYTGTWPITETLLSSPAALETLVGNPLHALASYYKLCLTTYDDNNQSVFAYLLPSFATLLGNLTNQDAPLNQSGTADDPWQVEILSPGAGHAALYLRAWQTVASPPGQTDLHFALYFDVPVSFQLGQTAPPAFDEVVVRTGLQAELLTLGLPVEGGTGTASANWLTSIAAQLQVTGATSEGAQAPLTTPPLAGVSLEVEKVSLTTGWSKAQAFYWSAEIVNAQLNSAVSNPITVTFASGSLAADTGELEQLAQLFVNALGLWILEHGGRFGLMMTAALGLVPTLPDLLNGASDSSVSFEIPAGLSLPSNWPTLNVEGAQSFFANSWPSLRAQLAQLFSTGTFAKPLMQLLGWSITGQLLEAPATPPAGTIDAPWSVLLADAWGLEVLIWAETDSPNESVDDDETTPQRLGFGLRKTMLSADKVLSNADGSGIHFDTVIRLDLVRFDVALQDASPVTGASPSLPRCAVVCDFTNTQSGLPLVYDATTLTNINSARLGVTFDLEGDAGAIGIMPVLQFDVEQPGSPLTQTVVELTAVSGSTVMTSPQGMTLLESLLNALMTELLQAIAPENGGFEELEALFDLLNDLGLAQAANIATSPVASLPAVEYAGINAGAWDAMTSNPAAFLKQQMSGVLQDANLCPAFFNHLSQLVNQESFALPPELTGVSALLASFGLAQTSVNGYSISPTGWLHLLEHPVAFLEQQGSALFNGQAARQQLMTALGNSASPVDASSTLSSSLQFNVTGGTHISLALVNPLDFGDELQITGNVVLDLQALSLSVEVLFSSTIIGGALAFTYTLAAEADAKLASSWGVAFSASPGAIAPPFAPLLVYPLPDSAAVEAYLEQLAGEIPLFLLSSFAGKALNEYVLPKYPFAVNVFNAFGLTAQQTNETWRINSLLGVLMHPFAWAISPQVLGDGEGHLDLNRVGALLNKLPGDGINGPDGISVMPTADGITVDGLPYGACVRLASNATNGVSIGVGLEPLHASPAPCVEISAGISFGGSGGVTVNGDVKLTINLDETAGIDPCSPPTSDTLLVIESSYGQQRRGQFQLGFTAYKGGASYPVTLVPFGGLNQFIPGDANPAGLLAFVSQKLSAAYDTYKDELPTEVVAFIEQLQTFAAAFGLNSISDLVATVEAVASDAPGWLTTYFGDENITAKLDAIYSLLTDTLMIGNLERIKNEAGGNLIHFVHQLDDASTLESFAATDAQTAQSQIGISIGSMTVNDKTVFGIFVAPQLSKSFLLLTATAGVGVPLQSSLTDFEFTLEASIGINPLSVQLPVSGSGPQLALSLDVDTAGQHSFTLDFYPVGPATDDGETNEQSLVIELLPAVLLGLQGTGSAPVINKIDAREWLYSFAMSFLSPLVADILLYTSTVSTFLNQNIGPSSVTTGAILKDWGLLTASQTNPSVSQTNPSVYELAGVAQTLGQLDAAGIVKRLLIGALSSLKDVRIIGFQNGGGIYIAAVSEQSNPNYIDYGIRLQLIDFHVTSHKASGAQGSSPPASETGAASPASGASNAANAGTEVLLQLGKWPTGDSESDPWIQRAGGPAIADDELGLTVYFVREDNSGSSPVVSFHAGLNLISVGMDVKRYGNQPLVNLNGFRLGSVEPRIYLSVDIDNSTDPQSGVAIRCDDLGLPLGPNLTGGGNNNGNPVAQNLLQTSSSDSNNSGGGPQSSTVNSGAGGTAAVNPTFSMAAAYVNDFDFQLYGGQSGDPRNIIWFPIQRTFGPLNCQQIGVGWEESTKDLFVAFDGSVILAGLAVSVEDLSIGIPVATPLDYDSYVFGLEGLNVSFEGGPVEITGGLLKSFSGSPPAVEYTGDVLIKVKSYSISAFGSYAVVKGNPSLFIFVMVNAPIGGPAFFFITGLSGGFGYNRDLLLPSQNAVQSFPLVAGITDPSVFGGQDPLVVLNKYVPPAIGEYWLAAGIQFTSFDLLQSSALLVFEFGQDFEIALLGLTTLVLPKQTGGGTTAIVYAELQLSVTFKPSTGLLAVTLALTSNSYILDMDCRLTGGFAFYIWFSGEHSGEFVVTLGGYSPFFTPPDYYPVEPRLGFDWPVSDDIEISGGAYFALTPSCVMAGGSLSATYNRGRLSAWFDMEADFLVAWHPFHYDIYIDVSVGASYSIHVLVTVHFSITLGASLHIWGPRMQGTVHISWSVISFTVSFGDGDSNPNQPPIIGQYSDFYNYFLAPQNQSQQQTNAAATAQAEDSILPPAQYVVTANAAGGLLGQFNDAVYGTVWNVRADEFVLTTATNVPATEIVYDGDTTLSVAGAALGIRPMGFTAITSPHNVRIVKLASPPQAQDLPNAWSHVEAVSNAAAALWDTVPNNGNPAPDAKVIRGAFVGVQSLSPKPVGTTTTPPPPIDLEVFQYDPVKPDQPLPLATSSLVIVPPVEDPDSIQIIETTVMQPPIIESRERVLAEVLASGTIVRTNRRLDVLAAAAETILSAPPMLGKISTSGEPSKLDSGRIIRTASLKRQSQTPRRAPAVVRRTTLRALIRQYAHAHAPLPATQTARSTHRTTARVTGHVHPANMFATRHDRLIIQGHTSSAQDWDGSTRHYLKLSAGTTSLWELNRDAATPMLDFAGDLPVRVVALNQFHHALADTVLEACASSSYPLPSDTTYLALTGLTPLPTEAEHQPIVGWHRTSSLVQLTPKALLGEGVIVYPQAPVHLREGRRLVDFGLVKGDELIERNIVELSDGSRRCGWIETLLPAQTKTFAVMLGQKDARNAPRAEDVAGRVRVTLPLVVRAEEAESIAYTALEPDEVVDDETGAYLLYTIPDQLAQAAQSFLRVRVATAEGLVQEGIFGFTDRDGAQVKAEWAELKLEPRGVSTGEAHAHRSTIEFSS